MASGASSAMAVAFKEMGGVFTTLGEAISKGASSLPSAGSMPSAAPMGASPSEAPGPHSSEAGSSAGSAPPDVELRVETEAPPARSTAAAAAEKAAARAKYGFVWAGRPTVIEVAKEWPGVEEVCTPRMLAYR